MSREKLQFEAFSKGKSKEQKVDKKEVEEKQAELQQKTTSLAEQAKSAFAKDDLQTTLDKLRELQKAVLPESEIKPETLEKLEKEFDRQVENLIDKGYAKAAELSDEEFKEHIAPLKDKLRTLEELEKETKENHIPFVVVIKSKLASLDKQIPLMEIEEGKKGFTGMDLSELRDVDELEIPDNLAYMIVDVENGKEMQGKSVDDATELLKKQNRTGLTTEEGIALIVQHPEILKDHNIDLSGSRCHDSGRVPNLELFGDRPELGWSYSDDAYSRWGSASCGSRIGS